MNKYDEAILLFSDFVNFCEETKQDHNLKADKLALEALKQAKEFESLGITLEDIKAYKLNKVTNIPFELNPDKVDEFLNKKSKADEMIERAEKHNNHIGDTNKMVNKLLPCPFCGGNNTKLYSKNDTHLHGFIHLCDKHKDCMVKIESRLFATEKEAVNAWNTRVALANEPLTLEQLKERVGKPVWDNFKKEWFILNDLFEDEETKIIDWLEATDEEFHGFNIDEHRYYDHEPKGERL